MSVKSLSLDPAPLGRTAAVVRLRRDIGNRTDLEAGGLQGTDRGLAARARALDEHVDLLHTVLLRLAGGVLGGQLRGERGRLARTLEADMPGRRPRNDIALRIGDRHDGVVERALDVCGAVRDVLLFPATRLLALLGGGSACLLRWHGLPGLLLTGDGALRALTGARIGLGPLAAHRQATAVAQALVAADLDLAADVGLHLAAQIALHLEGGFDVVAQVGHLIVGQVLRAQVPVDAGGFQNLLGAGTADAVDVGQRDLHALIAREVYAHKSGHGCAIPSVAEVWSQSVPSPTDEPSGEESSIPGSGLRAGRCKRPIRSVVLGFRHSVVV